MSRQQAALIALFLAIAAPAGAASYPSKPIRLVLGVGTGGVGDVTMRLFAEQLGRGLGQQIVVENRPMSCVLNLKEIRCPPNRCA